MSLLRSNVVFNYVGQFYVAAAGLVFLPLYLRYLGAEAYGLVGFFALLQAWMQLLDLGISPTLGREVARLKGVPSEAFQLRRVVRSLETVFIITACIASLFVFLSREWLATEWLSFEELDNQLVATCIGLVAFVIGARWVAALYRSGINAYEQQVWLNVLDILLTTLRFPGSLLLIAWTNGDLLLFFGYQFLLAVIEQLAIGLKFYSLLPRVKQSVGFFSVEDVRRIAPFAIGIAYTGAIWVLVSQLDKLLLSKVLSLADYGYFTLVASVSAGIMLLSGPVSKAVLPRMTALLAQGHESEMLQLYRKSTRLVVCMVAPVSFVLAFFPKELVYVWTGDAVAASWTAPILPLFVLGNGILAIVAFQYYLQYAHGRLRQHVVYNTVSALISLPLVTYAALNHGPLGVAWVWLGFRGISLLFWAPYIHHRFAPGLHRDWLLKDVLPPILSSAFFLLVAKSLLPGHFPVDRVQGGGAISCVIILATATAMLTAFPREIRERIRARS